MTQEAIMKILILAIIAIFGMSTASYANNSDTVKLRTGQQKTAVGGDLRIKFISVIEDSRCPPEAVCVWAGNAKISVRVTDRQRRTQLMTMNTNTGNLGDQFAGYAINLTELSAKPTGKRRTAASRYTAIFTVARLYR